MSEGNERSQQRQHSPPNYTMHPYYQQQYYAMAAAGQTAAMYPVADPSQPGGYRWVYAAYHPQMMQYYYQYPGAMYGGPAAPQPTDPSPESTPDSASESKSPLPVTPEEISVPEPRSEEAPPLPPSLERKTSRGFLKDKSKWRLSRSGSKPSLALDGTEDGEFMHMPPSPRLGAHKQSFAVSPRHCGSAFLPDEESKQKVPSFSKTANLHLIDAVRISAGELSAPGECLSERLDLLNQAMMVEMAVLDRDASSPLGLLNPANSKICYLNSVVQLLLPISPLVQAMSLSLTQLGEGMDVQIPWTLAIARALRLFHTPAPIAARLSLLTVPGMDFVVKELGGLGSQQDVGEALGIVLEKLHQEWRHRLVTVPWQQVEIPAHLNEDSVVYKLFRGMKRVGAGMEMFTSIHLAPPAIGSMTLVDLVTQNFSESQIHFAPPVLCIELSRHLSENQLTTSQTSVPFPGTFSFPASACTSAAANRKYQLVGVVVRSGVYANSGHFWVAQRRASWNWINDTEVEEIAEITSEDESDESNCSIAKKLNAAHNWCLLIYADPLCRVAIHP